MAFFPEDAPIPEEYRTQRLWLRVLRPDVTDLDYAALMESRERLRLWSDHSWPADDFTIEGNREDLVEHEREWEDREAFAYTVLSPDGTSCEGCVYIEQFIHSMRHRGFDPAQTGLPLAEDIAVVTFWVRDSALARQLDRELLIGLREWFATEWPFPVIVYRINDNQQHDRDLFADLGLIHRASHATETSPLVWHLFTEPPALGSVT